MDATDTLGENKLIPVVVLHDADHAVPLANALAEAGIGAMEITLRTEQALDGIKRVAEQVPGMLVGAGSLRQPEQFQQVRDAGAQFAVSPGYSQTLLEAARKTAMPFVPGAVTPSECLQLLNAGYILQKFFPAEQYGGVSTMRAISSPLPEIHFFPTGGINSENVMSYLHCANVTCVGGSWFIPPEAISDGDFESIVEMAESTLRIISTGDA